MGDGCWVLGGYLTVLLMSFANKPETRNLKPETETVGFKWAQKKRTI